MSPLLKKNHSSADEKYLLRKYCFLSGVYAAIIMIVFYIIHSNTLVFGDRTVLRMDLYHQYGPLFAELYDRVTQGQSLVYSWTSGLGGSFLGNLFNYCCSPFSIFMLICGHKNMPEAIALMIMFKGIFAAVTFTYYINKSNKSVRKESIAFGLLYAFSAYFVAYSWNIMWLDAMAIFPLVILGIEKIIQENKPALYIFSMTYTMITNYYMAYMVCILSIMYFLFFYFGRYEIGSLLKKSFAKTESETDKQPELVAAEQKNETEETAANANDVVKEDIAEETVKTPEYEAFADALNKYSVAAETEETENAIPDSNPDLKQNEPDKTSVPAVEEDVTVTDNTVYTEAMPEEEKNKKHKKTQKRKKSPEYKLSNRRFWVTGWTFALASFLCFMLAAFVLLPVSQCLGSSSATKGTFPEGSKIYFDIFNFLANHLPSVETTIRSSGNNVIPNVYCGLITLLLIPFYFLSKKIPGKQKVVSAVMLMAFYCGFALNYFNFIWHGMHMPNDLPYRYSFAYSFILLILAYKAYINIGEFSNKAYIGAGFVMMGFVVLVDKFDVPNCKELTILLTVIFTILYVVVLGMMRSPRYSRNAVVGLLIFTIVLEICVADAPKLVMSQPKDAYVSDYQAYQDISDESEDGEQEKFYRTELTKLRARMDPCWYGYNGVSIFSSMAYEHVAKLMEKMGLFGNNINSYTYYPQTPIFNSMFSLKYIYDNSDFINSDDIYEELGANDDFAAYKYKYFLPLAFNVNRDVADWDMSSSNPFEVQNKFMEAAAGVSDILLPVEADDFVSTNLNSVSVSDINNGTKFKVNKAKNGSEAEGSVIINVEEDGEYYIYCGSTKLSSLKIEAGDFYYNYVSSSIQPLTMDLGKLTAGTQIKVTYKLPKDHDSSSLTFCAAKLDLDKFTEAYNNICSGGTMNITDFDDTYLKGTVKTESDDKLLYTSIPYDKSWNIYVDGKLLTYPEEDTDGNVIEDSGDIVKVGNALIGFNLDEGEHEIEMKYKAAGLKEGFILTISGIGIIILIFIYKKWLSPWFIKKNRIPIMFRKPDYKND